MDQRRAGVALVRVARARDEDQGDGGNAEGSRARDAVFPTLKQKEKTQLADAAKELGIIRDSSAFVSSGAMGAGGTGEAGATGATEPPPSTAHHDGSASLAEVLLKQKAQKQEARDALIKASKVPVYDDRDFDYLEEVEEAKRDTARLLRDRENAALSDFRRMQNEAVASTVLLKDGTEAADGVDERPTTASARPGAKRARLAVKDRIKVTKVAVGDDDGEGNEGDGGGGLFGAYGSDSD